MKQWKRFIYIICFACVMLTDWTRGAFTWECWATSINLVGLLMAIVMAVNLSWKREKITPYLIWGGIWLLGTGAGFALWKQNPGTVFWTQYVSAAVGIGAIGVVALRMFREFRQRKDGCRKPGFCSAIWALMSLLMICSPLGEIWPLYYLIIFGLFYLVSFDGEEKRRLLLGAADGTVFGFFIIQIWAFGFRPYDVVRYSGAYNNCNINALFYVVTYLMVLYRLHCLWQQEGTKKAVVQKAFYVALAAALVGFVLLTMTRTALLALIGLTLVFGIFEFFIYRKVKFWNLFRYLLGYLICIMLLFPCVYGAVRYLPTILHHPVWWAGEYSVDKVHSFDPWNSEKYVSFDEVMDIFLNRVGLGEEAVSEELAEAAKEPIYTAEDGELLTGEAAKSSMRIRLAIYKKYLSHLNLMGHELEEGYMPITETFHAWHAQNVFVQVLFYYGVPAGILFLVLMVLLGVRALKVALRNREEGGLLMLLVWLLFIGYGMMECVWYPGQSILFYMYFVFGLFATRHKKVEDGK